MGAAARVREQGLSLRLWPLGGHLHCRVLSDIPGPHALVAKSTALPRGDSQKVSRHARALGAHLPC